MEHDGRTLKRWQLITYPEVFDKNSKQPIGRVLDITTEGVKLISKGPIDTNKTFNMRMSLPLNILGSEEITFDVSSLWSNKDINPDYYSTGFRMTKIANHDVRRIEHLVREFSFRD